MFITNLHFDLDHDDFIYGIKNLRFIFIFKLASTGQCEKNGL